MNRTRALSALAGLTAVGVCLGALVACTSMIQREDLVTVTDVGPSSHDCAECHVDITREWAASAHARAFTSEAFQRATLNAQTASCLPCHVPASVLHVDGQPQARAGMLDEGVTCIACHLDTRAHAMVGPLTGMGPMVPHAVVEGDAWFRSGAMCIACHETTGREAERAASLVDERRTCQECHMGGVQRKTTQATDALSTAIVALHDEHEMRSHTFDLEAVAGFPDALGVTARPATGEAIAAEVTDLLSHAIPTGEFGHREAVLSATLYDASGHPLAREERRFRNRAGEAMEPGVPIEIALTPSGGSPARVAVDLTRVFPDGRPSVSLASAEVTITPAEAIP